MGVAILGNVTGSLGLSNVMHPAAISTKRSTRTTERLLFMNWMFGVERDEGYAEH
jgi:hypothetical protein